VPTSDLIETARAIRQSYKATAEEDPAGGIGQEAADVFNKLLDESKKRYSKDQFIEKMHPVTTRRTQLAGLLAKGGVFEDSLKAEGSTQIIQVIHLSAKTKDPSEPNDPHM